MKRKFTVGILATVTLVTIIFALSSFVWLREKTEPSGELAAENTMNRLGNELCNSAFGANLTVTDDGIFLGCAKSAGHDNGISIWLFDDSEAAITTFDERRKGHPVGDFHGYPSTYYENQDYQVPGGLQRVMVWRVRHMLFVITAFDDTAYRIARDPQVIAEMLYSIAQEEHLLPVR